MERLHPQREVGDSLPTASRQRLEQVSGGRETSLDADVLWMNRPVHDAAQPRNATRLFRDRHDATRGADDVHDVALGDAGADRVPVRFERADRDRASLAKAELLRPVRAEPSGEVIRGEIA